MLCRDVFVGTAYNRNCSRRYEAWRCLRSLSPCTTVLVQSEAGGESGWPGSLHSRLLTLCPAAY